MERRKCWGKSALPLGHAGKHPTCRLVAYPFVCCRYGCRTLSPENRATKRRGSTIVSDYGHFSVLALMVTWQPRLADPSLLSSLIVALPSCMSSCFRVTVDKHKVILSECCATQAFDFECFFLQLVSSFRHATLELQNQSSFRCTLKSLQPD